MANKQMQDEYYLKTLLTFIITLSFVVELSDSLFNYVSRDIVVLDTLEMAFELLQYKPLINLGKQYISLIRTRPICSLRSLLILF